MVQTYKKCEEKLGNGMVASIYFKQENHYQNPETISHVHVEMHYIPENFRQLRFLICGLHKTFLCSPQMKIVNFLQIHNAHL